MMLNSRVNRRPLSSLSSLGTVAAAALVTFAVAGYGATGEPTILAAASAGKDVTLAGMGASQLPVQPATQKPVPGNRIITAAPDPLAAASASPPAGQAFSTFYGVVFDPTNRIVPGVRMSLVNEATQAKYEVLSDGVGRYEFVGLPPGEYAWQATLAGFVITKGRISISSRTIVRQDVDLRLGSVSEAMTVRATLQGRDKPAGAGATSSSGTPGRPELMDQAERVRRALAEFCPRTWSPDSVGGHVRPPTRIQNVDPVYPYAPLSSGVGGVVILEALLDVTGSVSRVVVRKTADPELDRAAVEAIQQWLFIPTLMNCTPVETRYNVTVSFVAR